MDIGWHIPGLTRRGDPRTRSRVKLLRHLPRRSVGAELDVRDGRFSREILRRVRPVRLHLIDAWLAGGGVDQHEMERRYREVGETIGRRTDVKIHRESPEAMISWFEEVYFDWICLGEAASSERVLEPYLGKVKPGGRIAVDGSAPGVGAAVARARKRGSVEVEREVGDQLLLRRKP